MRSHEVIREDAAGWSELLRVAPIEPTRTSAGMRGRADTDANPLRCCARLQRLLARPEVDGRHLRDTFAASLVGAWLKRAFGKMRQYFSASVAHRMTKHSRLVNTS